MSNYNIQNEEKENAVVITVCSKKDDNLERKTDEINRLCFSAGLNVVKNFHQVIRDFKKATVIGSGKVEEIKEYIYLEQVLPEALPLEISHL